MANVNANFDRLVFLSDDIKVSVNDFIIKAAAVTLKVSSRPQIILAPTVVSCLGIFYMINRTVIFKAQKLYDFIAKNII